MILVSGTGRSGTSMWMQILGAAGLPLLGEAFPRDWAERIGAANTRGFFESSLSNGINFTTNPNPRTGARLHLGRSDDLVAKVFLWGIRRTAREWLGRVLVSVRGWRAFRGSVFRLYEIERATAEGPVPQLPTDPALGWFAEHVLAIRDALQRGYLCRFVTYDAVLADPERVVGEALAWIGLPSDIQGAIDAVARDLRTQRCDASTPDLPREWVDAFDALYERIAAGPAPNRAFLDSLLPVYADVAAAVGRQRMCQWSKAPASASSAAR